MAQHFDLVILGSGSTAFAAALHAAELGKTAVMTEVRTVGGTCVNRGCLPRKTSSRQPGSSTNRHIRVIRAWEKLPIALGHEVSRESAHTPQLRQEQSIQPPQREIAPKQEHSYDWEWDLASNSYPPGCSNAGRYRGEPGAFHVLRQTSRFHNPKKGPSTDILKREVNQVRHRVHGDRMSMGHFELPK